MEIVYKCGHHCYGDGWNTASSAQILGQETNRIIKVSFWEPFSPLVSYFNNVEFVHEDNLKEYKVIDCGQNPEKFSEHNAITRHLRFMSPHYKNFKIDYFTNIDRIPKEDRKYISIVVKGNVNGQVNPEKLELMLSNITSKYPDKELVYTGHFDNITDLYRNITEKYGIKDKRTTNRTSQIIIEQLKNSVAFIGVHTGPIFTAISLDLDILCQHSKNPDHDYLLNFPNKNITFY